MSAHTPGPWAVDWNVSRIDVFSADASTLVATLRRSAMAPDMDRAACANARLVAAAPDLLNALTVLADVAERKGIPCDAARAAIAKATLS